jgi:mono/diheme cytochrome c family protein
MIVFNHWGGFKLCALIRLRVVVSIGLTVASAQAEPPLAPPGAPGGVSRAAKEERLDALHVDLARSVPLYRAHCLECHDADGRGQSARDVMNKIPDFTDPIWHDARTDHQLTHAIREGAGLMAGMKDKLSAAEMVVMVKFVRGFRGGKLVVPEDEEDESETPARAIPARSDAPPQALAQSPNLPRRQPFNQPSTASHWFYLRLCASCHGSDGTGGPMRGSMNTMPDFTSRTWQEQQSDVSMIASILEGKGTQMPSFHQKLSEAQAREVVIYLRSFAGSSTRAPHQPPNDFDQRFEELMTEMADLKGRFRVLASHSTDPTLRSGKEANSESSQRQTK